MQGPVGCEGQGRSVAELEVRMEAWGAPGKGRGRGSLVVEGWGWEGDEGMRASSGGVAGESKGTGVRSTLVRGVVVVMMMRRLGSQTPRARNGSPTCNKPSTNLRPSLFRKHVESLCRIHCLQFRC